MCLRCDSFPYIHSPTVPTVQHVAFAAACVASIWSLYLIIKPNAHGHHGFDPFAFSYYILTALHSSRYHWHNPHASPLFTDINLSPCSPRSTPPRQTPSNHYFCFRPTYLRKRLSYPRFCSYQRVKSPQHPVPWHSQGTFSICLFNIC